ncbi:MAG: hypothetical protein AVDCRST_MAG04-1025, partial [uncultured Acetobacteraceae bacterium]
WPYFLTTLLSYVPTWARIGMVWTKSAGGPPAAAVFIVGLLRARAQARRAGRCCGAPGPLAAL